jgi:hypothetical protein
MTPAGNNRKQFDDSPQSASVAPRGSEQFVQTFVKPPGKLCLLYGTRDSGDIFSLSLRIAAEAMLRGSSIAVVDGCNRFNVHLLARFARERRIDPNAFLQRIFISRGFTCYQIEQAVSARLPAFLKSIGSETAMVFGLLDTLYDEQAPFREVQQILRRVLQGLQTMKHEGHSVLLTSTAWNVMPKERNNLFATLQNDMDTIYQLRADTTTNSHLIQRKGAFPHGTNRADIHQHHRQRDRKLVEIPERTSKGGSGTL